MQKSDFAFSKEVVSCYFDESFSALEQWCRKEKTIIICDDNVLQHHQDKFEGYRLISITPGERNKVQSTVDRIIDKLIEFEADKHTWIIGVGGGVVTDIAGYAASIYKRGVSFALVPTTILAMVDAAIGGKNGVNVGMFKNMVGTVYQPQFILYDYDFLQSLPVKEWVNGFAEIIKHACIKDEVLFNTLERYSLHDFQADKSLISSLIEKNAALKMQVAVSDEFDQGERRLLNFGHTFGHALENLHGIPHGYAISIGMVAACNLSEKINHLHYLDAARVVKLLAKYHLPVDIETDHVRVFNLLKLDKKREDDNVQFILLNGIGSAETRPVSIAYLEANIKSIL